MFEKGVRLIFQNKNQPDPFFCALLATVWFATTAFSVSYVWKYRGPTPSGDEWFDIGHATGEQPLDWAYLWGSANDHRVPFVRLLYAAIMRACALDVRSVAVANVLIPATTAAVAMIVLRRRRGHSSLSDAAIPLALTNLGMWEPFLWNALLHAAVGVSLITITLLIVTRRDEPTAGRCALVGGLGLLLLGCGGPGVPYLPALALWLGIVGIRAWIRTERRTVTVAIVAAAILATGVFLYFLPDGAAVPGSKRPVPLRRTAEVALQFLAVGYGPVAFRWLPIDPVTFPALGLVAFTALAALGVVVALRRSRIGLTAAAGALCFLLGYFALAYGLAANRAHDSPTPGYGPRYTVIASFGVIWLVVACQLVGGRIGAWVAGAVVVLTAVVWVPSYWHMKPGAVEQRNWLNELRDDARAGVPSNFVAHRFADNAGGHVEYLHDRLVGLKRHGVGPFATLGNAETRPTAAFLEGRTGDAAVEWIFPRRHVTGLIFTHEIDAASVSTRARVEWRAGDSAWAGRRYDVRTTGGSQTWVWVNAEIDRVRFVVAPGTRVTVSHVTTTGPDGR
jgi:hypothetical protein